MLPKVLVRYSICTFSGNKVPGLKMPTDDILGFSFFGTDFMTSCESIRSTGVTAFSTMLLRLMTDKKATVC